MAHAARSYAGVAITVKIDDDHVIKIVSYVFLSEDITEHTCRHV